MTNKTTDSNRPTHAIWHVEGEGDKARWTRIGAAWMHRDQKGANLRFSLMPLVGRIVLREIAEQESTDEASIAPSEGGAQ
jgi:hypothetical protein